jgi:uncharacterized membrane protein YhiD involved in acid resistance
LILHYRGAQWVHGLTNAAVIWVTALFGATARLRLFLQAGIAGVLGYGLLMIREDVEH